MSGTVVPSKSGDNKVPDSTEVQQCSPSRSEADPNAIEMIECKGSNIIDDGAAIHQSELSTKVSATDASEDKEKDKVKGGDFDWMTRFTNIRYIRLDGTANDKVKRFLWALNSNDIIFSIISDGECDKYADKMLQAIEAEQNESVQSIRKIFCSSLVEAAAATNACIITGGLSKGVDQLIGNDLKQREANHGKIPKNVLGFSNWECIAEKNTEINDSLDQTDDEYDIVPTGLYLNEHHTHFLLFDYDTMEQTGCKETPRELIESNMEEPMIYTLIGGRINAFSIVERALADKVPVIIAMGTGGAADIISGEVTNIEATLECLPEITEKLFSYLNFLLTAAEIPTTLVQNVLANITSETKLEQLFEIVELLDQTRLVDEQQFKDKIATLLNAPTSKLLDEIKALLISKQNRPRSRFTTVSYNSASNAESDTVSRMRTVFEQMLVVNGIPREKAKYAFDSLEPEVLKETLTNAKNVFTNLKAIRTHNQKDLLIILEIANIERNKLSSLIVETVKKAKWSDVTDLYRLAVDWDNQIFFRQLLEDNWMRHDHDHEWQRLFDQSNIDQSNIDQSNIKYVKLMLEYIGNREWLTKTGGPLEKDFAKNEVCADLMKKIKATGSEDERCRLHGKLLFIWCVLKRMRETAMLFWMQGQDCLTMALIAYKESKKQKEDLLHKKGYDDIEQQTQFFAKLALDFMSKCYADDFDLWFDILDSKVKDLNDTTPYHIAINANFEEFFCADAMQDLVDGFWAGYIENHKKHKYVPLLLSELCPVLAPALLQMPTFDSDDETEDDDENKANKTVHRIANAFTYIYKVKIFMDSPLVKFTYRFISYFAYLILFSIVMLTDFRAKISPMEIAISIWTFILIAEEGKQALCDIREYQSNGWNYFDIGALTIYAIGFTLRMMYHVDPTICPNCLYVARIVLAFSLMICFFRALQFLSIFDATGPTIYMIRHLFSDLVSVLLILSVFISAYGVVSNIILYPNQELNTKLLQDVFYDAWWSVIQQFNREDASGSNCNEKNVSAIFTVEYCSNMSDDNIDYKGCKENRCPANSSIVSILLVIYSLLTCIMLLNVLIAMFNATFSTISNRQKEVSKLQRFQLMVEYDQDSMIPPPLCVIAYPYQIIKYFYYRCRGCHIKCPAIGRNKSDVENRKTGKESETYKQRRLRKEELVIAEAFYRDRKETEGWPVARWKLETVNKFDKEPWMKHIVEQIRNQIIVEKLREEITNANVNREFEEEADEDSNDSVNEEAGAHSEPADVRDATKKKEN